MDRLMEFVNDAPFVRALARGLAAALQGLRGGQWKADVARADERAGSAAQVLVRMDGDLSGYVFLRWGADALAVMSTLAGKESNGAGLADECVKAALAELASSCAGQRGEVVAEANAEPSNGAGCALVLTDEDGRSVEVKLGVDAAMLAAMQRTPSGRMDNAELGQAEAPNLDLVLDVELNVVLRFGQRRLSLREVLELASGSVIELDRQVEEPVELLLEGKVIARGEAVVVDGNYGLRVTEVPQPITQALLR